MRAPRRDRLIDSDRGLIGVWMGQSGGADDMYRYRFVSQPSSFEQVPSLTAVTPDTWHQIAVTYDRGAVTIYLDGAVDNTGTMTHPLPSNAHPLVFGAEAARNVAGFAFNGLLDEIRIWNRALSAAELAAIHAREAP